MSKTNTLFLIAKHGLKMGSERGLLESWMWNLSSDEETMKYLSLHNTKGDRAYKGGEISTIRDATDAEVAEHQEFLRASGKNSMHDVNSRKIIVFRVIQDWNELWPSNARANPMAYKATGHI